VSRESSYVFVLPLCLQIADAVVIARYLGATLVLPEIRGDELGKSRYVSGEMMLFYSVLHTPTGGESMCFTTSASSDFSCPIHEHLESLFSTNKYEQPLQITLKYLRITCKFDLNNESCF
jgi:hypothetical protein